MASKKLSPLGKGLKALLPVSLENQGLSLQGSEEDTQAQSPYFICPIDFIKPNPYQPRKEFNSDELQSLANSISQKGILQPLVVSKTGNNRYELIAGERRLRAAQIAELEKVPVLVKDIAMSDRLELALIENIQRQSLNPLEEAEAYAQLIDEFALTQETVAKRVGKNRSTIANCIRLLQLPDFARSSLSTGEISSGHARVLLGLNTDEEIKDLHDLIIQKRLSVRETETLAKKIKAQQTPSRTSKKQQAPGLPESFCKSLTNSLVGYLGSKSKISQNGDRGKIEIEYYSADDLERVLALIIREN